MSRNLTRSIERIAVSFFVPVVMSGPPVGSWEEGPYPNHWRTGTRRPLSGCRLGRAAYINPGLDDLLYTGRWFRLPDDPRCAAAEAFKVKAFELFQLPTETPRPTGILIVHGRITDTSEPFRVLDMVVNHNEQHGKLMRTWVQGVLPSDVTVYPLHRRAEHITLMTYRSIHMPAPPGLMGLNGRQVPDAWLAYIASSGRIVPDIEMIGSVGTVIGMSVSLRGLVSKSGIALIGLKRDSGRSDGSRGFDYGGAEFFVEGLYSDTMLLAQLQKYKVRELRERLNSARAAGGRADQLASLEQETIAFRVMYWRRDLCPFRGGLSPAVLGSCEQVAGGERREPGLACEGGADGVEGCDAVGGGGVEVAADPAPAGEGVLGVPVSGDGLVAFDGFCAALTDVVQAGRQLRRARVIRRPRAGCG